MIIRMVGLFLLLYSIVVSYYIFANFEKGSNLITIRVFDGFVKMPNRFWLDNRLKSKYCSKYSQFFKEDAKYQGWFHVCGGRNLTIESVKKSLAIQNFKMTDNYEFNNYEVIRFEGTILDDKSVEAISIAKNNQYLVLFEPPNDEYWKALIRQIDKSK